MKLINIKIILIVLLSTFSVSAQQKLSKASQSIKVNKDVTIDLNTSFTNIEIDTWNKDIIEVEAYMESDVLSKEELQKYFDAWHMTLEGSNDYVTIKSDGSIHSWEGLELFDMQSLDALKGLELELANLPVMPMVEDLLESLHLEEMPQMPQMPELPELPKGMTNIDFDYDEYQESGEAYMERWSKEYGDKFGKDYAKKMEDWAKKVEAIDMKKFEVEMEAWGEKFGEEFELKFDKDFEKKMELWGENYGKQIEVQAKLLEKQFEENEVLYRTNEKKHFELYNSMNDFDNQNIKKTIKIRMPKKAKLKINVRHGELKMASVITNLKADVSHAVLLANSIDGGETFINASYSSLLIDNWDSGELKLNYVEDALLKHVGVLILNSNSSNIDIDNLAGNAVIDGSFGDLTVHNILDSFSNLNIVILNSDALLNLPKSDYNLFFKGTHSRFNDESTTSETIKKNTTGNKAIVINAKYSNVITQ